MTALTAVSAQPHLFVPRVAATAAGQDEVTALAGLRLVRHALRRDLDRFSSAIVRTSLDDTATWCALGRRWDLFAREVRVLHLEEDEVLWAPLRKRIDPVFDGTAIAVLDALEAERLAIAFQLETVGSTLAALASHWPPVAEPAERAARAVFAARAASRARTLADALDEHAARAERDAVTLIDQHLTAADRQQPCTTVLTGRSPGELLFTVPWLADGLAPAALDGLLDTAPVPLRWALLLGRRSYRRLNDRAFCSTPVDGAA
jgi:hypothetical protein